MKPVPPIEITEAYGPPIIWYDRLINLSMRCSTWRGNDPTKLSRQAQLLDLSEIQTTNTLPVHDIIHRQRSFSPLIHSQYQLQVWILHHPSKPTAGVSTPPAGPGNLRQIQNIHYSLLANYLRYRMRYHPSFLSKINICLEVSINEHKHVSKTRPCLARSGLTMHAACDFFNSYCCRPG